MNGAHLLLQFGKNIFITQVQVFHDEVGQNLCQVCYMKTMMSNIFLIGLGARSFIVSCYVAVPFLIVMVVIQCRIYNLEPRM